MDYITTKEASVKWKLSQSRIRRLAKSGKIPSAKLVGHNWMFSSESSRPVDGRKMRSKQNITPYRFPLSFLGNYSQSEILQLSKQEQVFHKAQLLYCKCSFSEAEQLLEELLKTSDSVQIKIGVLYFLCFTYLRTRDFDKLEESLSSFRLMMKKDFEHKEELKFIYDDLVSTFDGLSLIRNKIRISASEKYSTLAEVFITIMDACRELADFISNEKAINPTIYELACSHLENEGYYASAMYLHYYIGTMYQVSNEVDNALIHFKKSVDLSVHSKCYAPLIGLSFSNFSLYEKILCEYPNEVKELFFKYHSSFQDDYVSFINQRRKINTYKNITDKDFKFINYVSMNVTNKKIAILENISERTVNKKYQAIYQKLGISGKKELYELAVSAILEK